MSSYIQTLLNKYPTLFIKSTFNSYVIIEGSLTLNHQVKELDVAFYKEIQIKIKIDKNYPAILPKVYEIGNKISSPFYHINPDKSLCIGTELDVRINLYPLYSLVDYIEKFIFPFFYSYFYYEKYKISPFSERSHGNLGIFESIQDFFKLKNKKETLNFIKTLSKRHYNRIFNHKKKIPNYFCPCNSGKKIYSCHKEELLLFKKVFQNNYYFIENLRRLHEQY